MGFHVFDTFVKSKNGHVIHFDIITDKNDLDKAISFGKEWLKSIGENEAEITTKECRFCHTQSISNEIEIEVMTNGYFIAKMEGCPK
ncbi:MAG: DUF2024 family protein [Nitrosarchaeum sp.]|nr:DUF2024 family protein [Nitrosarchaeum sp.]MBP0120228.1 DUF2024 family protein [Nitrosarchaeum sp.]